MPVNRTDLVVAIVIAFGALLGWRWGAVRQLLTLLGTVAGLVALARFGGQVGDALLSWVASAPQALAIGRLATLAGVTATVALLASATHRSIGLALTTRWDSVVGMALGAIQTLLFLSGVGCTLLHAPPQLAQDLHGSLVVARLIPLCERADGYLQGSVLLVESAGSR